MQVKDFISDSNETAIVATLMREWSSRPIDMMVLHGDISNTVMVVQNLYDIANSIKDTGKNQLFKNKFKKKLASALLNVRLKVFPNMKYTTDTLHLRQKA